jgi:hypothetical protein
MRKFLGLEYSLSCCAAFIGPGIKLAFLVKGHRARSLYVLQYRAYSERKKFLDSSTYTTDFLLFYVENLYRETAQDDLAETLMICIQ